MFQILSTLGLSFSALLLLLTAKVFYAFVSGDDIKKEARGEKHSIFLALLF